MECAETVARHPSGLPAKHKHLQAPNPSAHGSTHPPLSPWQQGFWGQQILILASSTVSWVAVWESIPSSHSLGGMCYTGARGSTHVLVLLEQRDLGPEARHLDVDHHVLRPWDVEPPRRLLAHLLAKVAQLLHVAAVHACSTPARMSHAFVGLCGLHQALSRALSKVPELSVTRWQVTNELMRSLQ